MEDSSSVQIWFSQSGMPFAAAVDYCTSIGAMLFEPLDESLFNQVIDFARQAGVVRTWIGVTDIKEEGM